MDVEMDENDKIINELVQVKVVVKELYIMA